MDVEPLIFFHGSKNLFKDFDHNFSYFSQRRFVVGAYWFTDNFQVARSYGKYVYEVNLKIARPYIVDANFENYSEIYLSDLPDDIGIQIDAIDKRLAGDTINEMNYRKKSNPNHCLRFDTADLALAAKMAGYDSLIVHNVIDAGNKSALKISQNVYSVFNVSDISLRVVIS